MGKDKNRQKSTQEKEISFKAGKFLAELSLLYDIIDAIESEASLSYISNLIVEKISKFLKAKAVIMMMVDRTGGDLRLEACTGIDRKSLAGFKISIGEGLIGKTAKELEPQQGELTISTGHEIFFNYCISVPIVRRGNLLGTITVCDISDEDGSAKKISEAYSTINMISKLAAIYTKLYVTELQFDPSQSALKILGKRLDLLLEISSQVMGFSQELDDSLNHIMHIVADSLKPEVCILFSFKHKKMYIRGFGEEGTDERCWEYEIDDDFIHRVKKGNNLVELLKENLRKNEIGKDVGLDIKNIFCEPIRVKGRPEGGIGVINSRIEEIPIEENIQSFKDMLSAVGNLIGLLLLVSEVEEFKKKITSFRY